MFILNAFLLMPALLLIEQVFAKVPVANNEAMEFAEVREIKTRSPNDDPRSISVQVTAFGETRNLLLAPRKDAVFAPAFQGFVADVDKKGKTIFKKVTSSRVAQDELHSKLYTDSTGTASLYVERSNGHIALEGMLDHETRIVNEMNRQGRSLTEPINHVVYKRLEKHEETCRSVTPNITGTRVNPEDLHVQTRALPTQIYPETVLVIDYKTSSTFNFDMEEAKKYIAVFFNAVNRRYTCPDTPKITFVITGIILTNNPSAEPFLRYSTTPPLLDSQATLYAFGEWLVPLRSTLPSNDIVLWMTGLDFASNVVGIAFVGGACWLASNMNVNVGLVRDQCLSFSGVHTMTHEIAHLFGSAHDGDIVDQPPGNPGAVSCPWSGGYIMSYQFGTVNRFAFSSCSCNQFQYTFNSGYVNCLLNNPASSVVSPNSTLPGAIKSLDEQCKCINGANSAFYEPRLYEVCVKMWCGPAVQEGSFSIYTSGPALEGSRCGTNKVCINGACV